MVATPTREQHTVVIAQPTFTCLFEQAEHFLEQWMPGRDRQDEDELTQLSTLHHYQSMMTSIKLVDRAMQSKAFQKRTRVGMLLHQNLVEAIDRISVKV